MNTGEATLPLRPLTVGELLDAGIAVLRRDAPRLLGLAALLAVIEQLVLLPVRSAAHLIPPSYIPNWWAGLGGFWVVLALGLGTEAVALTLLGAVAARSAVPALLGPDAADAPRPGAGRYLAVVALALGIGVVAAISAFLGLFGWIFWFAVTGLIAPAFLTDLRPARVRRGARPVAAPGAGAGAGSVISPAAGPGRGRPVPIGFGRAVGRGFGLVFRAGLRPGVVRLVNYLAWLLFRLALGWGLIETLHNILGLRSKLWLTVLAIAGFALADTIAYAAGGCLDAVLHLESRIRLEGLDLAIGAARRRGTPAVDALVVPTAPGATTPGVPAPGVPRPGVSGPGVSRPGVPVPGVSGPGFPQPGAGRAGAAAPGGAVPGFAAPGVAAPGFAGPGSPLPGLPVPGAPGLRAPLPGGAAAPGAPRPGAPEQPVAPR